MIVVRQFLVSLSPCLGKFLSGGFAGWCVLPFGWAALNDLDAFVQSEIESILP